MKRYILSVLIFGAVLVGAALPGVIANAQEATPMTEVHIARIRANCIETQSSLNQLHATDALLRVNRGQLYESISTKLMAPLNARIGLNHLDGAMLVAIAADYERQLVEFRINYQQYEEAMSRTLKVNCTNQPVAFYDSVNETREKRKKVHDNTVTLQKTIQSYGTSFEAFAGDFEKEAAK
jgi:hypothetical protein